MSGLLKNGKNKKMMKNIKIGYSDYTIIEKPDKKLDGEFVHSKKELRLSTKLDAEGKLNTFLHETLHGVWFHWGLSEAISGKNSEETAVNALANGLTTLIRENPEFLPTLEKLASKSWGLKEIDTLGAPGLDFEEHHIEGVTMYHR